MCMEGLRVPEQSDGVVQRANQQIWIFVAVNIQTSRQRVPKSPEPRRDRMALDHLQRDRQAHRCDLQLTIITQVCSVSDLARFCRNPLTAAAPDHYTSCFMKRSPNCKVWHTEIRVFITHQTLHHTSESSISVSSCPHPGSHLGWGLPQRSQTYRRPIWLVLSALRWAENQTNLLHSCKHKLPRPPPADDGSKKERPPAGRSTCRRKSTNECDRILFRFQTPAVTCVSLLPVVVEVSGCHGVTEIWACLFTAQSLLSHQFIRAFDHQQHRATSIVFTVLRRSCSTIIIIIILIRRSIHRSICQSANQ